MKEVITSEGIGQKIFIIRGQKVMLDKDIADLYGVKAIRLREQVKRNKKRFPPDFMFQLSNEEIDVMVSHNAIPSRKHLGGFRPYVFTEQGVAMLATVLNSETAILANIAIMRAFVKLREALAAHKELAHKLEQLEKKIERHDEEIAAIFDAIRLLMAEPEPKEKKIGFVKERQAAYKVAKKR